MKPLLFLLIPLVLLLPACRHSQGDIQFYHWKTHVTIGPTEQQYMQQLGTSKLYMRMFDIDNQGQGAYPLAKVDSFDSRQCAVEYIPVVFVTNRTFAQLSDSAVCQLARNTSLLIANLCAKSGIHTYHEIQIDCDWTQSTRYAYFKFLEQLQQVSGKQVTCTIRLHQVKYHHTTGVPPVAKGYIMCYATANPSDQEVQNSILDIALLKDYMASINDYPLPFDIALPIYSWAVVTNHLGSIKLINAITPESLDTAYFVQEAPQLYRATRDGFLRNIYINTGFTLRFERISPQLLAQAKDYLSSHVRSPYHIVYYHLDNQFLKQYTVAELQ